MQPRILSLRGAVVLLAQLALAADRPATRPADESALAKEVAADGWIVFGAMTDKKDWDLFVMRPDGSQRRNITATPDASELMPRVSPDGTRMIFRRAAKGTALDNNRHGTQGTLYLNCGTLHLICLTLVPGPRPVIINGKN